MSTRWHPAQASCAGRQPLSHLRFFVYLFIFLLLPVFVAAWKVTVSDTTEARIRLNVVTDLDGERDGLLLSISDRPDSTWVGRCKAGDRFDIELPEVLATIQRHIPMQDNRETVESFIVMYQWDPALEFPYLKLADMLKEAGEHVPSEYRDDFKELLKTPKISFVSETFIKEAPFVYANSNDILLGFHQYQWMKTETDKEQANVKWVVESPAGTILHETLDLMEKTPVTFIYTVDVNDKPLYEAAMIKLCWKTCQSISAMENLFPSKLFFEVKKNVWKDITDDIKDDKEAAINGGKRELLTVCLNFKNSSDDGIKWRWIAMETKINWREVDRDRLIYGRL
eukprot:GHVS01015246.1.p1 GENE.GHVS01015246.1~~GHVS01015246.1.p1  ORF type:complete len:340 (-),score=33.45 GHVS01015246.1:204-1223(-)